MQSFNSVSLFFALFFISVFITSAPIHGLDQPIRKLDESPVPGEQKCNLCDPSPPPPVPSPPPPSPPPPAPVLSPPPPVICPPPPSPPPSGYCPPPPVKPYAPPYVPYAPYTPPIIYITSPPGGLYPIDNDFGGGAVRAAGSPVLIGCGLLLGILLVRFGF